MSALSQQTYVTAACLSMFVVGISVNVRAHLTRIVIAVVWSDRAIATRIMMLESGTAVPQFRTRFFCDSTEFVQRQTHCHHFCLVSFTLVKILVLQTLISRAHRFACSFATTTERNCDTEINAVTATAVILIMTACDEERIGSFTHAVNAVLPHRYLLMLNTISIVALVVDRNTIVHSVTTIRYLLLELLLLLLLPGF